MKITLGSIHRKAGYYYLIISNGDKKIWQSLKTKKLSVAKRRAKLLLPRSDDETEWLEHLVKLGKKAEQKLRKAYLSQNITWENLFESVLLKFGIFSFEDSRYNSYKRWLEILCALKGDIGVCDLDFAKAEEITNLLAEKYVSFKRIIGFYRKCWQVLGLEQEIWRTTTDKKFLAQNASGKKREFYRRLHYDEIIRIYEHLLIEDSELADMFAIGYNTGLRLCDVANLDTAEIIENCVALKIVPDKTRRLKKIPITIPLIFDADEAVRRRLDNLNQENAINELTGGIYIFSPHARHRPSRKLCAAFKACKIIKHGQSRASFHSLRATFISQMDEAGIPPHITDAITGHSSGGMHTRYSQPQFSALKEAMTKAITPINRHMLEKHNAQ